MQGERLLKAWRFVSVLALTGSLLAAHCASAAAAPGDLDRTFGRGGVAELPFDPYVHALARDVVAAPDGKLFVLRSRSACGFQCPTVERLRPDGTVDETFGSGGVVGLEAGGLGSFEGSLAMTPDGKVLVATFNRLGYLTRLNPDGSIDSSFGEGGSLTFGRAAPIDSNDRSRVYGVQVAVDPGGKVVLGVDQGTPSGSSVLELSRYVENGVPDPSFGGGKPVGTAVEGGWAGLALFDDARIAVAGAPCCSQPAPIQVARLLGSGAADPGFGGSGLSLVDRGLRIHVAAVLPRSNGGVDLVASREGGYDGAFALRFRPDGSLDPAFGRGGVLSLNTAFSWVSAALVDRHGRLVIVGTSRTDPATIGGSGLLAVLRLRPDGRVDRTFNGGVRARLLRLRSADALAGTFGHDGRIVVLTGTGTCVRSCTAFHSHLVQYIGGSSSARCLGRRATIVGTRRRDVLRGTPRRDVIATLGGDDTVRALGGNDLICGGRGLDHLFGGPGRDRVRQ
ncbi:MAG: hypothetical protein QOF85_602 [Solirubrobacterales bacterium]|jgi:uncharacterized delta-60 repeat protein|nr:hypothetical protein [Solirubrobacterales bacterium]